ncbi:HigA family addiction module antitoxin [Methylobacterium fujisawaense]|uniref:HigA family addiction module antitoxin n=1 Tax=Methylobacterium fujisawaense TaxID=107400 RepID=UPI00344D529A
MNTLRVHRGVKALARDVIEISLSSRDGAGVLRLLVRADPRSVVDLSEGDYEVTVRPAIVRGQSVDLQSQAEHPGQAIRRIIMVPNGLSAAKLAELLGMHETTVHRFLSGRKPIIASLDIQLAEIFKTRPGEWIALQAAYDRGAADRQVKTDGSES